MENLAQGGVAVVNAGEAHVSHPTQGLLDVLTIRQRKGEPGDLRVVTLGQSCGQCHAAIASIPISASADPTTTLTRAISPTSISSTGM